MAVLLDHTWGDGAGGLRGFSGKMLAIGLLVALTSVFTGLSADASDPTDAVTSRSFVRGILVILLTSVTLSLVI